jgi:hypothetical protein
MATWCLTTQLLTEDGHPRVVCSHQHVVLDTAWYCLMIRALLALYSPRPCSYQLKHHHLVDLIVQPALVLHCAAIPTTYLIG